MSMSALIGIQSAYDVVGRFLDVANLGNIDVLRRPDGLLMVDFECLPKAAVKSYFELDDSGYDGRYSVSAIFQSDGLEIKFVVGAAEVKDAMGYLQIFGSQSISSCLVFSAIIRQRMN